MRKYILLIMSVLVILSCYAMPPRRGVPANRQPKLFVQPNGDSVTIYTFGDERNHWRETDDGYLVRQDSNNYYCYALYADEQGGTKPSEKIAHDANKRTCKEKKWLKKNGIKKR